MEDIFLNNYAKLRKTSLHAKNHKEKEVDNLFSDSEIRKNFNR